MSADGKEEHGRSVCYRGLTPAFPPLKSPCTLLTKVCMHRFSTVAVSAHLGASAPPVDIDQQFSMATSSTAHGMPLSTFRARTLSLGTLIVMVSRCGSCRSYDYLFLGGWSKDEERNDKQKEMGGKAVNTLLLSS